MTPACDVVVVGGGPAGAATAMLLALAGREVVLLERREFPRPKPCGDCISAGAGALLDRLGVRAAIDAKAPARLHGWRISSAHASFAADFGADMTAYALERSVLDGILLDAARDAGVRVVTHAHVRSLLRDAAGAVQGVAAAVGDRTLEIRAALTIGADGLRSRVARLLNAHTRTPKLRKFSLTAHVRGVSGVDTRGEMHVLEGLCLGIAPVEEGSNPLCNVTVVSSAPHAVMHRSRHELMRALLARFQTRNLAELVSDDVELLASGPFDWPVRHVLRDGAVLVGDAAGYYDPFTGQGIYQALAGAELLADCVVAGRLHQYGRAHRALTRPARRVQKVIEFVCARPRMADRTFAALAGIPELASRLVQVTGDARPVRDLLSPRLLPRLLLSIT